MNIQMKKIFVPFVALAMIAAACGGNQPEETQETTPAPVEAVEEVPAVAEVSIEGNDQMKYNLERIDVKEGQTIRLTMKNVGQLPKEAMGHNWILLAQGTDKEAFAAAAMAAKDNDYIPAEFEAQIIAHTPLLGPGEEATIEFAAPAKGFYTYVCSFPGHMAFMKGTLYVN
jgi:azurin